MTKEITTKVSEETLAILKESYPQEQSFKRISLPRLSLVSQDKTEGRGKSLKVVAEAGTFFLEEQTDEQDENGRYIWKKTDLGKSIQGIIFYQRNQLRMYDSATEEFTNSPIYDSENEIVPLFRNRLEVERGTPVELKAKFQFTDDTGKVKSRLEDNRVLYILYKDKPYQMNLRGSSMYSFLSYARKMLVPSVITEFSSTEEKKGQIEWNKMSFTPKKELTEEEIGTIIAAIKDIKVAILAEKGLVATAEVVPKEDNY